MENKRLAILLAVIATVLLIPLIGMQFSEQVNWSIFDFVVAFVILMMMGFLIDFVSRKVNRSDKKIALIIGISALFVLIWAELSVGIFGTPFAGS